MSTGGFVTLKRGVQGGAGGGPGEGGGRKGSEKGGQNEVIFHTFSELFLCRILDQLLNGFSVILGSILDAFLIPV